MPKSSINFQNTVIYKIQHIEKDELIYIGHTTNFTRRKCEHKSCCSNEKSKGFNLKIYKLIRQNGGWELFNMIELYKFPCNNSREAEFEEDKVMREYKSCMNSQPAISKPEDHKEKCKIYRDKNKVEIAKCTKLYNNINRDKIKEYKQQYRLENLDKIKEKAYKKCIC